MAGLLENLARSVWLLLLFAPVLLTAPVALQLQWKRAEWIELLRKTLEAAGRVGWGGAGVRGAGVGWGGVGVGGGRAAGSCFPQCGGSARG